MWEFFLWGEVLQTCFYLWYKVRRLYGSIRKQIEWLFIKESYWKLSHGHSVLVAIKPILKVCSTCKGHRKNSRLRKLFYPNGYELIAPYSIQFNLQVVNAKTLGFYFLLLGFRSLVPFHFLRFIFQAIVLKEKEICSTWADLHIETN